MNYKQLVHWKIDQAVLDKLRKLAEAENRSITAQAEYLLRKALTDD